MQLTQVQLAQIVSSAVSQALTQHVQQTANNPTIAGAASTAVLRQVQTPINFDVSVFEEDSAASWLALSQCVGYQGEVNPQVGHAISGAEERYR